jgi:hypothetical protein
LGKRILFLVKPVQIAAFRTSFNTTSATADRMERRQPQPATVLNIHAFHLRYRSRA